ncbi:MAG: protein kinase domain-containing protein [Isosphaeraceae bacterium]
MNQAACPTLETLSAFALGELPEPELSAVAEHLDCCAECSEQAARFDEVTDPFVSELKRVPEIGPETDSAAINAAGANARAAQASTHPVEFWGEFRIVREIGRGGMGVVCEAFQGSLNRHVALKFLPELGDLARFRREARAAGRLHHTNIVPVFGVGEQNGRHFYVMQYIAGRGLDAVFKERALATGVAKTRIEPARVSAGVVARLFPPLRRGGQGGWSPGEGTGDRNDGCAVGLDGREAARIGVQVAEALAYAHAQGVIHRDIKPSNLLLDEQGTVWVTDFGLAHDSSDTFTLTHTGEFLGSLRYVAPERLSGQGDERADIYALGVTLYELVCGRPAYEDAERSALVHQILNQDPPSPRQCNPRIARDLETIIIKAMERDAKQRYATADALAADLRRFLEDRPIAARRTMAWERAIRWCRRNPVVASMTAAVFISLAVVAAVASIAYVQTKRSFDREAKQLEAVIAAEASASRAAVRALEAEREMRTQWYAATVNLMRPAWGSGQMERLRSLLLDTEPYADRGFEWYYFRRLSHLEQNSLVGHLAAVRSVSWSPDGTRLATASWDGTAKVWDAAGGKELLTLKGHSSALWSVAWSPEGKRLATASVDGMANVWDASSGGHLLTLTGHKGQVCALSWSPDGRRLATGSWDWTIRLWDTIDGHQLLAIQDAADYAKPVSFSPDGKLLAAGCSTGELKLWDAAIGRETSSRKAHKGAIHSLCWSPDGKGLATASADGTVKVWESGSPNARLSLKGHSGEVLAVAWSKDGRRLATGSRDRTARIWDAAVGKELLVLKGHTGEICSVSWSRDGKWLATGCDDGTAKVWPASGGRESCTLTTASHGIASLSWSPDGTLLAIGSRDGTVKLWGVDGGREMLAVQGHPAGLTSVAWSPDGRSLATSCLDRTVRIWDASSGRERMQLAGHEKGVDSVLWSHDGTRLATASRDATARVWDAGSGRQLLVLKGHSQAVTRADFSPDGTRLATASTDKSARVWDASDGRSLLKLTGHSGQVLDLCWSRNGARLVTGSADGSARVWDARDGRPLLALEGHAGEVRCVSWSPDGTRLLTGSRDGTARLWGAGDGRELLSLKAHPPGVYSLCWSPDGMRLATGGLDGAATIWEAAGAQAASSWRREDRLVQELLGRNKFRGPGARGFFRDWLLLLPLPFANGEKGAAALDRQQLAGEAHLCPREGEDVRIGGRALSWRAHRGQESIVDFNAVLGQVTERSVAYAVCYLESDRARNDLCLQISSDDQAKLYLNGQEVYRCRVRRQLDALDTAGPVPLKQGSNVLLLKVANEKKEWESCVRLVDSAGRPAEGIHVELTP